MCVLLGEGAKGEGTETAGQSAVQKVERYRVGEMVILFFFFGMFIPEI